MIGVLVVTHGDLGDHLIRCASHVVGERPEQVKHLGIFVDDDPDAALVRMRTLVKHLDTGDGVLVLCDILGATPCNIASYLIQTGQIACLSGINLPMLVRALTYRSETLSVVVEKALNGGKDGVVAISAGSHNAT